MKWEDLGINSVDDLEQNEHTGRCFGDKGQVRIIGRLKSAQRYDKQSRRYVVECSVCKEDTELFGDGVFAIQLSNLTVGNHIPCACSLAPKWSDDQMKIRASRKCADLGYTFIEWSTQYKGNTTRINIINEFGQEDSIKLAALLRGEKSSLNRKKNDIIS